MDKKTVLEQYFGHSEFREGQQQIIDAVLSGRDVLCVMPTGAGKSICYQVPALMFEGITVVISPLISLMKDQVNALTENGISAAFLNSSLTVSQYNKALSNMRQGRYKIVYVAPERLLNSEFIDVCKHIKVDLLAVDEAHCISQWGQDFRPGYLKIADFVNLLGYRPVIAAFTATATAEVKDDIEYSLRLQHPYRVTTGFDRPNLKFSVIRVRRKFDLLLDFLKKHKEESGIVYCSTRPAVEELGQRLGKEGYSVATYHAGLEDGVRRQNQEDFVYDRKSIMIATNAFGMGIDKSNVSFVIHYNMPKDLESYYQEAGRAGRDGSAAECILFYSPQDLRTQQYLIEQSTPNPELTEKEREVLKERDYDRLKLMTFYATANTCLRSYILNYFEEKSPPYCGNCSNCLTSFTEVDITVDAQKIFSCIKRTGERYGKKMICDILRGSKSQKLLRQGLESQTTYGLLSAYKDMEVKAILDFLEFEEYIVSIGSPYPVLALTEKARPILFEGERITMKKAVPKEKKVKKAGKGREKEVLSSTVDRKLFAMLKALRRKIADEKNLPAYIVFSDATLLDMCQKHPTTMHEMLNVSGVGRVKLEMYGEAFLWILKTHRPYEE